MKNEPTILTHAFINKNFTTREHSGSNSVALKAAIDGNIQLLTLLKKTNPLLHRECQAIITQFDLANKAMTSSDYGIERTFDGLGHIGHQVLNMVNTIKLVNGQDVSPDREGESLIVREHLLEKEYRELFIHPLEIATHRSFVDPDQLLRWMQLAGRVSFWNRNVIVQQSSTGEQSGDLLEFSRNSSTEVGYTRAFSSTGECVSAHLNHPVEGAFKNLYYTHRSADDHFQSVKSDMMDAMGVDRGMRDASVRDLYARFAAQLPNKSWRELCTKRNVMRACGEINDLLRENDSDSVGIHAQSSQDRVVFVRHGNETLTEDPNTLYFVLALGDERLYTLSVTTKTETAQGGLKLWASSPRNQTHAMSNLAFYYIDEPGRAPVYNSATADVRVRMSIACVNKVLDIFSSVLDRLIAKPN